MRKKERKKETLFHSENAVPSPQMDCHLSKYDLEHYCNFREKGGSLFCLQPGVITWYWSFSYWQQNTLLEYVGIWGGQYSRN